MVIVVVAVVTTPCLLWLLLRFVVNIAIFASVAVVVVATLVTGGN